MAQSLSLMNLFEVGAYRGNGRSKMNAKLKSRIYAYKNGLCIIDLVQTLETIERVNDFIEKLGQQKKQILVVGTSEHIKKLVPDFAAKFGSQGMPYINNRWLGGTLTNWMTIKKTLKTLDKLESIEANQEFFHQLARNEQLNVQKKKAKVENFFGGLKKIKSNHPGAILVLDAPNNPVAIKEAESMGVPIIALTNTSVPYLPKDISNVILVNIYSSNAIDLVMEQFVNSYVNGLETSANIKPEVGSKDTVNNLKVNA
jgi:small subunit ribosomal protein S2